jgi:uncharacterized protein
LPISLTDEMRARINNALTEGNPVMVATASGSGMPDLVFKGSMMVFDTEHLAYWERALGTTLQNLKDNPQACVMYRNPQTRTVWKMFGVAELHASGETRDAVMGRTIQLELDRDPDRKGVAVVIRIDRVLEAGKETMRRD